VNRLRLDWDQLNKNGELIRPYRHNVVAHLMLELDKATQRYQLGKIPDAEKLYTTIEDLLPIIRRSVVSLGFLFGVGADRIGLYEKMAKKNAAVFWALRLRLVVSLFRDQLGIVPIVPLPRHQTK
jgi:hypothetical protein